MVAAGRAEPSSYLALVDMLKPDDSRSVWDQAITTINALNRLSRNRAERAALQSYARARLRQVFDKLGWDGSGSGDDDTTLLRASLIRTLGEFGDEEILAEARRRFAGFLQDPKSLANALRDPVTHLVGISADRATYDTLLGLARKSTVTNERLRYLFAAASAPQPGSGAHHAGADPDRRGAGHHRHRDDQFGSRLPASSLILAWDFVRKNFDALLARQGPAFRDQFVANLMTNFSDDNHAAELAAFAPAQATSGGRVMTARALETIAISADLKARALPVVDAWIKAQNK